MEQKKILRVIDVNLNRCREGLRVIEDTFRFICENDMLRRKIRRIRHTLDTILNDKRLAQKLIKTRNTKNDLGKTTNKLEMQRENLFDIVYVNFQRAKESTRVLEELFKVVDKHKVRLLKKIRYQIYAVEKEAFKNWSSLCDSR